MDSSSKPKITHLIAGFCPLSAALCLPNFAKMGEEFR
ncbi:hypothetical protein SLEP1_g54098 [Rubroshorea leprosula]|uniref:Uncharacterized protein n=1 Tax=Rubroshorea leprosula TaxID=152421 RepID=A0AAV5MBS9_9ROSI|nr:hypothetical protein SLEP1_g30608 [Rubroshorea leprosula]GKV47179.1 hypothetical protein SLEP1_g54098 [Rubroshorea leprosula]